MKLSEGIQKSVILGQAYRKASSCAAPQIRHRNSDAAFAPAKIVPRRSRTRIFLAALVLAAIFIIGCNSKPSPESIAKGKDLAYTRCTACHEAKSFEKHRYSRGEWRSVISRMMSHGAQFTQEEQGLIADFLSSKFGK